MIFSLDPVICYRGPVNNKAVGEIFIRFHIFVNSRAKKIPPNLMIYIWIYVFK